ncbi:RNA polymerase sigma factor (sigma-70 family) [Streptomyces sp. SAI-144]|jgi:RNA polymerase sigma-70 factor (ECF subfamily)|nr:RNA polymerase sigma factor (sigma-70 family) [Streptomyces sp. SAI-144]MDH6488561.1 RNA polymerase sigma factor (sigma-70 family) [Streptomyces sp. SAI-127]
MGTRPVGGSARDVIVATETTGAERTGLVVELSLRDRIRAGDTEAFAELFGAHARAVYSHAARLSADRGTAEDVVSLTFLEAWRLREKLRPEAAALDEDADVPEGDGLRPWLYGIATNVLRNTRRAARRHSAALARLPDRPADRDTLPDFADDLVGRMEHAERLAAARTALGRLRKAERDVFALCVWSGLSYADAGEALGVPASTVRSRLARARQRLRTLSEAELARRTSAGRTAGSRGRPSTAATPDVPPPQERPGLGTRTGQVPGGRPETARSTQEKDR